MTGRLAAMFVFVPNFLPNGRSQTTASTLALGRGSTAHTQSNTDKPRGTATHDSRLHAHLPTTYFISSYTNNFFKANVFSSSKV